MSTKPLTFTELSTVILDFACSGRSVLFTGAGVGKKVGFPLWGEYLESLASVCADNGDEDSATLMRKKIKDGNFLGAAGIYEDCQDIIIGERWKHLAAPFTTPVADDKLDLLAPLFGLPFGAIITTNYDRSQHDASARIKKRAPIQLELDGNTMRGGADQTSYYIARIHGAAESATSMVLYPSAYKELARNEVYEDFLLNLLRDRPCLFVGFSFVDPAIDNVLSTYARKAGELFKTPHAALLPSEGAGALHQRLSALNIKAYFYDPADGHKALWKAFRKAEADFQKREAKAPGTSKVDKFPAHPAFQRFLAFTYAQVKLSDEVRPVLEQARDGVILSFIRDRGDAGIGRASLCDQLRKVLNLDEKEADRVVREATGRLFADQDIRIEGEMIYALGDGDSLLDDSMAVLVDGVLDRVKVREAMTPAEADRDIAQSTLERTLMVRSWDLAAHYAGGGTGYGEDLYSVVHEIMADVGAGTAARTKVALERCCIDLLTSPTDDEAEHLAEVSRAAFSLQLVLSSPRQSLLQRHALPQRVYFDASVLLPAIVPGHPLRNLYIGTIQRLQKAAKDAGINCELCVGEPFLNEVVSHREKAVRFGDELDLDTGEGLQRMITLYGAENTNVYIGAFASHIGQPSSDGKKRQTFRQFLQRCAPYSTEDGLAKHLTAQGFRVMRMDFRKDHHQEYHRTLNSLLMAYERMRDDLVMGKEKVLVEHEAAQLVQLEIDRAAGVRSVFVSNDRKLRRAAISRAETRMFADYMVPPEGFVGLVDIMVGIETDQRALARLVWAAPRRDADVAIRDYLVRRALEEQDVAYAKAIPEVIDEIVAAAKNALKSKPISFSDGNDVDAVVETAKFMDRFEKEFFEKMRRAIERQEKQGSDPKKK